MMPHHTRQLAGIAGFIGACSGAQSRQGAPSEPELSPIAKELARPSVDTVDLAVDAGRDIDGPQLQSIAISPEEAGAAKGTGADDAVARPVADLPHQIATSTCNLATTLVRTMSSSCA